MLSVIREKKYGSAMNLLLGGLSHYLAAVALVAPVTGAPREIPVAISVGVFSVLCLCYYFSRRRESH
jgi:hypothetical protein